MAAQVLRWLAAGTLAAAALSTTTASAHTEAYGAVSATGLVVAPGAGFTATYTFYPLHGDPCPSATVTFSWDGASLGSAPLNPAGCAASRGATVPAAGAGPGWHYLCGAFADGTFQGCAGYQGAPPGQSGPSPAPPTVAPSPPPATPAPGRPTPDPVPPPPTMPPGAPPPPAPPSGPPAVPGAGTATPVPEPPQSTPSAPPAPSAAATASPGAERGGGGTSYTVPAACSGTACTAGRPDPARRAAALALGLSAVLLGLMGATLAATRLRRR